VIEEEEKREKGTRIKWLSGQVEEPRAGDALGQEEGESSRKGKREEESRRISCRSETKKPLSNPQIFHVEKERGCRRQARPEELNTSEAVAESSQKDGKRLEETAVSRDREEEETEGGRLWWSQRQVQGGVNAPPGGGLVSRRGLKKGKGQGQLQPLKGLRRAPKGNRPKTKSDERRGLGRLRTLAGTTGGNL